MLFRSADEAFMSGTPFCMLPVTAINGQQIGNGKMGDITTSILDAWGSNVEVDIIKQIKERNKLSKKRNSDAPSPYSFNRQRK